MTRGFFHDGQSAIRREVEVSGVGDTLILDEGTERHGPFPVDRLEHVGERREGAAFGHKDIDGWRLVLPPESVEALAAILPAREHYGGWVDRLGLGPATIGFALLSAIIVAIVLAVPQWLAPLVPYSVEQRLGDAMIGDFGGRICHSEAGDAALAALARRLDDTPGDLEIAVVDVPMVNAAALPGGKIVIFRGMLNEAKSSDELAGVLAHEIGHVRERHVMQSLIRQLGLSVVLGGANGDVGGALNSLLSLGYGRDAEREADRHSIAAMRAARISPDATAAFFDRLSKQAGEGEEPSLFSYLSTHPHSKGRRDAFAASAQKGISYRPALSPQQWDALRTICPKTRDSGNDEDKDSR